MSAATTPLPGREFDRFLYASVGDYNGMPLTVLSALARMDVDPWEEASKLMSLPRDNAVEQLTSLLGALRNGTTAIFDPAVVAAPLVALLPPSREREGPLFSAFVQAAPTNSTTIVSAVLSVLTYVIFMLFGNYLMGSVPKTDQTPMAASAATFDSPTAPITPAGASTVGRPP